MSRRGRHAADADVDADAAGAAAAVDVDAAGAAAAGAARTVSSDGPPHGYRMPDEEWDRDQRNETTTERLDRNWVDLLQELRVVQTGVQLLTGFLLTLPFQQRFTELTTFGRVLYMVTVGASVLATGLLVAPVMIHRLLFRRHARHVMVNGAHRLAVAGTTMLGVALVGVVLLVFDVVFGRTSGVVAASVAAVVLLALWAVLPLALRRSR